MPFRQVIGLLLILSIAAATTSKAANVPARTDWFMDQGLGMFIHWSVDSQLGSVISHSMVGATPDYLDRFVNELPKTFYPQRFDPDEWARLAKVAGMKYVVFTTKHHSGFCMFDTKTTDFGVMHTPYGRDITKQLFDALRKQGIAVGVYFSPDDFWMLRKEGIQIDRGRPEVQPRQQPAAHGPRPGPDPRAVHQLRADRRALYRRGAQRPARAGLGAAAELRHHARGDADAGAGHPGQTPARPVGSLLHARHPVAVQAHQRTVQVRHATDRHAHRDPGQGRQLPAERRPAARRRHSRSSRSAASASWPCGSSSTARRSTISDPGTSSARATSGSPRPRTATRSTRFSRSCPTGTRGRRASARTSRSRASARPTRPKSASWATPGACWSTRRRSIPSRAGRRTPPVCTSRSCGPSASTTTGNGPTRSC